MLPFPLEAFFQKAFDPVIFFTGKTIFGITTLTQKATNSGDTTYDYVRVGTLFLISLLLGLLFITLLRNKVKFELIRDTTFLYARYFVGLYMISYGFAKILDGQFSLPTYGKLEQSFGNSSPMGLLWTFMGVSKPYTLFIGFFQIVSGYLILFKRTKTIGSLLTIAIMLNVVVLNFCYDVPVKLFSVHLLIIAIFIVAPDLKPLYSFFILRIPTQLTPFQQTETKYRTARYILKGIIIGGFTIFSINLFLHFSFASGSFTKENKIDGVYSTELFVIENDTLAPVISDSTRWKSLIISQGFSKLTKMTDSVERFKVTLDSISSAINFLQQNQTGKKFKLKYSENKGKFQLAGLWKGKKITAIFTKKTYSDYLLINRGFHWINETIYNR
jgi:hypothetical protein